MSEARNSPNFSQPSGTQDPSMEEILSSIRRILADEQTNSRFLDEPEAELLLDTSMRVEVSDESAALAQPSSAEDVKPKQNAGQDEEESQMEALQPLAAFMPPAPALQTVEETLLKPDEGSEMEDQIHSSNGLIDEHVTSQVMNSVGSLLRTVSADRNLGIGRQGLTLEDIAREELRPLLKVWLDANLPSIVDGVVRAEINRLINVTKP